MKWAVENSSVYVERVGNQLMEQLSTWSGENGAECQALPSWRGFSQMPLWEAWRMGQDQRTIYSQSPAFGTGQCQDCDALFVFAFILISREVGPVGMEGQGLTSSWYSFVQLSGS